MSIAEIAPRMIDTVAASRYTGISKQGLIIMRMQGNGPPYSKFNRRVRYDIADLDAWIDASKRRSTSEAR